MTACYLLASSSRTNNIARPTRSAKPQKREIISWRGWDADGEQMENVVTEVSWNEKTHERGAMLAAMMTLCFCRTKTKRTNKWNTCSLFTCIQIVQLGHDNTRYTENNGWSMPSALCRISCVCVCPFYERNRSIWWTRCCSHIHLKHSFSINNTNRPGRGGTHRLIHRRQPRHKAVKLNLHHIWTLWNHWNTCTAINHDS